MCWADMQIADVQTAGWAYATPYVRYAGPARRGVTWVTSYCARAHSAQARRVCEGCGRPIRDRKSVV